jgi:hypothetical protein
MSISHGWTTLHPDNPAKDVSARNLNDHTGNGLGVYSVLDYGAVGDGSTDDTVAIQAALTAARVAGGGIVMGRGGDTYLIVGPLVIGSTTTLDMTGCVVTIGVSTVRMLRNYNLGGGGRDTDIRVTGGIWSETGTSGTGEEGPERRLCFNQVDRLTVDNLRVTTTSGKYAIELWDVTQFTVSDITLDVHSDGVHVTGPASYGTIRNISGRTGDDLVALGCTEYILFDRTRGDITDVTIETIRADMVANFGKAVTLITTADASYAPQALAIRRVSIRDVKGTTTGHGVTLHEDAANALAAFSDITISDVNLVVPAGYGEVTLETLGNSMSGIYINNIHIPRTANDNTIAVSVLSNIDKIIVNGLTSTSTTARVRGVTLPAGITIGTLVLSDVVMTLGTDLSNVVSVSDTAAISDLSLINVSTDGTGSGNVVHLTGGNAAITRLNLLNVTYDSGNGGILYHQSSATPDVNFANVRMLAAGGVIFYIIGTGGVDIRGTGATAPTYWVYRSGSQVIHCYSTDIHVDVDLLTATDGAMAFNTNGGHSCGTGPVVSEGTHWKGLYNGTAY